MIWLIIALIVIVYIVSALYAYSITLGYFQRKFWTVRSRHHYWLAILYGVSGPFGAITAYVLSGHGRWGHAWTATNSEYTLRERQHDDERLREAPWKAAK